MSFTYIIWSPQGEKPPTVTYNRRWKAENEAKRLSLTHPNQVFHVCKIKSATVAGQSAYFGKWRPRKKVAEEKPFKLYRRPSGSTEPWTEWKPAEHFHVAFSEADLIDEQSPDMLYRLGMAAVTMR